MADQARLVSTGLGVVGALAGGALGYFGFAWADARGYYWMILPGAMLGFGCGLLSRHASVARGVACGVAALALGLYTEWRFHPFRDDESFPYLLTHVHQFNGVTMLMLALGTVFAFWLGKDAGYRRFGRVGRDL